MELELFSPGSPGGFKKKKNAINTLRLQQYKVPFSAGLLFSAVEIARHDLVLLNSVISPDRSGSRLSAGIVIWQGTTLMRDHGCCANVPGNVLRMTWTALYFLTSWACWTIDDGRAGEGEGGVHLPEQQGW